MRDIAYSYRGAWEGTAMDREEGTTFVGGIGCFLEFRSRTCSDILLPCTE